MENNTPNRNRPKILVTSRLPVAAMTALADRFDVVGNPNDEPWSAAELTGRIQGVAGFLPTVTDPVTAAVLEAGRPTLEIVANYGVGVNHVDLAAARRLGIVVTNTPDVLTDCTADLTIGLMLMVLRRLGEGERQLRAGRWTGWRPTHLLGSRVSGKTLGIIGMGRIGQAVARRAGAGFGMEVLYASRRPLDPATETSLGVRAVSLEELLRQSDVVSLHCPATPETRHLINHERLALMRPGAVLLNTARGSLVDEAALVEALRAGRLGGAGLDVFEAEPLVPESLVAREDVVLLPHLGSATVETRTAMGLKAVANLEAFFGGQAPPDRVG